MYKKNGYAGLLVLLVVLAIGALLYFLDMQAVFGPGLKYNQNSNKAQDRPWQMENLLVPQDQIVSVPRKGQPELLEPVTIDAPVQRNTAQRGAVKITFGKNCRVIADWSTQYEYDKKTYQIQTQMKGNIVPSKIYSNANKNQDKTRLFFIAKGSYTQITQWPDTTPQTEQGAAYILGWLRPDHTAEGAITITTDQSWSAVYFFRSTAKDQTTTN